MLLVIAIIFLFLYALLISYYWRGWKSAFYFNASANNTCIFISIIIAARNEEKNITTLLKALDQQTYPKNNFEVIVIDDFSIDDTALLVKNYPAQNIQLFQPEIKSEHSSKKKAIETGVSKAKGELIVTTDADCIPPKLWLQTINDFYIQTGASFIAAPVKFKHHSSLLQIFQSIDFITLQGITAASVASGFHIMCNGANLAYKRKNFFEVNGFDGIDKIATGDDMLLMYKIWKKDPSKIFYLKNKQAIVTTEPMQTWKEFFLQRKRWASKTLVYDDYTIIVVLAFVYLFNCLFVILLISSFFNSHYWWYVLGFLGIKTLIEFPFVYSVSKFYDEQKLMPYFFFFQALHIFYTVVIGLVSQFGKYEWKGRRTK